MSERIEEVLAVEVMNALRHQVGDPQVAVHAGTGPGLDVEVRIGGEPVGVGEVSVDHDRRVMAASAAMARSDHKVRLPEGWGTWMVDCAPDVNVSVIRDRLRWLIATTRGAGLKTLWVSEVDVAKAEARRRRFLPPASRLDELFLEANASRVRSLHLMPGTGRDLAWLATSGGGVSTGDGNILAEFIDEALKSPPHDENVTKLLAKDQDGERHVVIVLGTATREHRWDVFHPASGDGFDPPPSTAPNLPAGISDAWVIHVRTGWSAWWSERRGWSIHDGQTDWWRRQTHLAAVRKVLDLREERA